MKKPDSIIIDDNILAVDRLENLLLLNGHFGSVLKLCDPSKAVQLILNKRPDLVFIDVEMPKTTGFDIMRNVRSHLFFPTFIILTAYPQYAVKAIKSEAFDYLIKPVDIDELNETMQRYFAHQKKCFIPENCCLTPREREILEMVYEGMTSSEIGEILYLSKHTVDTHRRKISRKIKR